MHVSINMNLLCVPGTFCAHMSTSGFNDRSHSVDAAHNGSTPTDGHTPSTHERIDSAHLSTQPADGGGTCNSISP
jgi:hypothetical protein